MRIKLENELYTYTLYAQEESDAIGGVFSLPSRASRSSDPKLPAARSANALESKLITENKNLYTIIICSQVM